MACGIVGKVPYIAAGGLSGTLHVAKLHPDIVMCTDATSKTRVVKHLQSLSKEKRFHQVCAHKEAISDLCFIEDLNSVATASKVIHIQMYYCL